MALCRLFGFSRDPLSGAERNLRAALFLVWLSIVLLLISRHVMWRDEVRALSLALQGDGVWQMLQGLRGEGHPALWYLLLRFAHNLFPTPHVLPVLAAAIGIGAMLLLAFRSPFRPILLVLILLSSFGLYEFVVMARNYGISMLILFAIAAAYSRFKNNLFVLPALIFLLSSCNAHSIILAAGFLIFWFFDVVAERGSPAFLRPSVFFMGCLAFLAGTAACYWEVSIPLQDAVMTAEQASKNREILPLLRDLLFPSIPFGALVPVSQGAIGILFFSLLFWCALAGLAQRPGLLLAGLAAQTGMALLFHLVYPGTYRHGALFLVFLLFLYWLAATDCGGRWPWRVADRERWLSVARSAGCTAMICLLLLQVPIGMGQAGRLIHGAPESSSAAFGALLKRTHLQHAILVGDPDYHLEALPYYARNRTYFIRENRFGRVVHFSSHAKLNLELGDILTRAKQLRDQYRAPVVITLEDGIDPAQPVSIKPKGYVWTLKTTPVQVRSFLKATCRLARFREATSDENYDVYLLPIVDEASKAGKACKV